MTALIVLRKLSLIAVFSSLVALLAGCVSPSDLRTNTPTISATTKKDPKKYALCVFPQWQDARSEATMSETENGYRLVIGAMQLTDELLEIKKTPAGSAVAFYQRVAWMPGVGRTAIEAAVRNCL
ncbi:hypothetical protein JFU58_03430 [Pseudomonas sp. TH34]|uniref:hypothetical protein n=1 Tax=Pseudomonas TaxID=286 RepID=UPI001911D33D|nr:MULTISPECIES: hypothetical protein [Pseudomonas]MBK5407592.1 hypothetical protein [Pseudomonas sp. TH34]MBV6664366.1 hypothetical protein [Pseudomonas yamanorum]